MAKLELNDVISELREENTRLSNELLFANKCLLLFEKYRNHLTVLCLNCVCDQNIDNKLKFFDLEEEYNAINNRMNNNNNRNNGNRKSTDINNAINIKNELTFNLSNNQLSYLDETNAKSRRSIKRKVVKDYDYSQLFDELSDDSHDSDCDKSNKDGDYDVHNDEKYGICFDNNKLSYKNVSSKQQFLSVETDCDKNEILGINMKDKRKHGLKGFRCNYPECDYGNTNKNEVQSHINKVHNNERPFKCDSCEKGFPSQKYLTEHQRNIHQDFRYRCDWPDCTFETRDLKYLKQHRMRHTGNKPFKCKFPSCSTSFVCKSELKGHQRRVHSEVRAHRCEWQACNLAFKTSTYLKQHMRTHTGERPFVCEWPGCDQRFAQMQHLDRHKLIHREIRNFGCTWPECDKRFRTNWHLKMHMMVHRGDRPFKCEWAECDRTFTEKRNMLRHYDTHKNKLIKIDQNFANAIN